MNDNTNNIELYEENDTNEAVTAYDENETSEKKKKSSGLVGKVLLVLAGIGIAKGIGFIKTVRENSKKKKGRVITVTEDEVDESYEEEAVE